MKTNELQQLNNKIAKFMGWTYIPDSKKRLCWKTPEGWLRYKPPAFSTNMTMAMLVVEKMEEMGFWVMMGDHDVDDEGTIEEIWWCKFYPSDENILERIEYANTAPKAICLAALSAVANV